MSVVKLHHKQLLRQREEVVRILHVLQATEESYKTKDFDYKPKRSDLRTLKENRKLVSAYIFFKEIFCSLDFDS